MEIPFLRSVFADEHETKCLSQKNCLELKALREGDWGRCSTKIVKKKGVYIKQIAIQVILSLPNQNICADYESEKFASLALSQI